MPSSAATPVASSMARSEKSMPVTFAPRRAHESESMPKWHWTCSRDLPATSPTSSIS